jgi:hypothetical protein
VQKIFGVLLEGFDLLLSQGFLVPDDVLFALIDLTLRLLRPHTFLGALHFFLASSIAFDHLPIEATLLFLVDNVVGVIVNIFVLFDFFGMVNDHVGFKVKLGSIERDVLALLHSGLEVLLHLILEEAVDGVVIEVLPLDALVRVDCEHTGNYVLSDIGNAIDVLREAELFVLDVIDEFNHVGCLVGWSASIESYEPKSIS